MSAGACPRCGAPAGSDDLFCEACGTRVGGTRAEAHPSRGSRSATMASTSHGTMLVERPRDHVVREVDDAAAVSDRGHHHVRNEDAFALGIVGPYTAAIVCDGVSTTSHPDRAARAASRAALGDLRARSRRAGGLGLVAPADLLVRALRAAQAAVLEVPELEEGRDADTPSTTIVAALVEPGRAVVASIGDSRAYWIAPAPEESGLLTTDDSWAEEAIEDGMEPESAYADPRAHGITRWLGEDAEPVEPTISEFTIHEPGHLVLCTDGLWNYFESAERLARLLDEVATPEGHGPLGLAQGLVAAALAAGGRDNVTVAVIRANPGASPTTNRE